MPTTWSARRSSRPSPASRLDRLLPGPTLPAATHGARGRCAPSRGSGRTHRVLGERLRLLAADEQAVLALAAGSPQRPATVPQEREGQVRGCPGSAGCHVRPPRRPRRGCRRRVGQLHPFWGWTTAARPPLSSGRRRQRLHHQPGPLAAQQLPGVAGMVGARRGSSLHSSRPAVHRHRANANPVSRLRGVAGPAHDGSTITAPPTRLALAVLR
jgi:hypothetical protein